MLNTEEQNLHHHTNDGEVLVRVENVSKKFCRSLKKSLWYGVQDIGSEMMGIKYDHELRPDEFWSVKDVSFELRRGECLGLVGRNGAGKSTLLRMLNGLIKPDRGCIEMQGRVGALIALGTGFNPILTGRENIYVNGSVLGLSKTEIDGKIEEIIEFAGIEGFIDSPVQGYSSGMQVRLGFAVATALSPDVLILDEVLAVGDAAFRNKCYRRIANVRKNAAVIFVSHNMEQVARICDKTLVMSVGEVAFSGNLDQGIAVYDRLNDDGEEQDESFLSVHPPLTYFQAQLSHDVLSSGSPLDIQVSIKSSQLVQDFFLRINVYSQSGACVAEGNFFAKENNIAILADISSWNLSLASFPLKNGYYSISFAIVDQYGDIIVWSYKQHKIKVVDGYHGACADCLLKLDHWTK
jgi:lipopolysaccharide transport system ATP-binding protein